MTQANEAQQTAAEQPGEAFAAHDIERIRTANLFAEQLDNRSVAFNAEIEPLLRQIAEIAQKNGVPFLAAFDITSAGNMRDDGAFNMAVGCFLPEAPYSERLRQTVAILRPRTREEQAEEAARMTDLLATLANQGVLIPGLNAPEAVADDHEGSTPD